MTADSTSRICVVCPMAYGMFDPSRGLPFGGAELQVSLLARELAKEPTLDIVFVAQDFGQPRCVEREGITIRRCVRPFKTSRLLRPLTLLVNFLSMWATIATADADVYLVAASGYVLWESAVWCRLRGRRLVYRMASDADVDGSLLPTALERWMHVSGLRLADAIVSQNTWEREELEMRYGKGSTIVAKGFHLPDGPPDAAKDGVLWVASAHSCKQPNVCLDLADALPDVAFTMVMPTRDLALSEQVRDRAARTPNVGFVEQVPADMIQPYFDRARVFLNTSTVEGYPNTFAQACMGATPIVSLIVDPSGVLGRERIGLCADGDTQALQRHLERLLGDDDEARAAGARAFAFARRTHDITQAVSDFRRVLAGATTDR